ncbi:hypothetical protein PC121_g14021 [Phytophthora cactorum]|nr:hypothetical protein PC120_g18150 [Phytophthora cactorum]KAG3059274.1 hypothetical protein PC121_g14021 [Phytophthora cactorum]
MDAEQAPAANPDQLSYEETLERWALYDYSAFENPRSDDEMRDLFQRWRATRSKPVTVGGTVTPRSLDRAWTAFVERWNTETGAKFVWMLERREATRALVAWSPGTTRLRAVVGSRPDVLLRTSLGGLRKLSRVWSSATRHQRVGAYPC